MSATNSAHVVSALMDLLWPNSCLACGFETTDPFLCSDCLNDSKRDSAQFEIAPSDRILPAAVLWKFERDAPIRKVLHRLKYGNCPWIGHYLGRLLAQSGSIPATNQWDLIVPIPLHRRRLLERGYNQSEWIAEGLGQELRVPVGITTLRRSRHTTTQTDLTRVEREANLDGAFSLSADGDLEGLSVLLVDDTLTTGATLHAAAATLLDAGVAVVQPTAVARAALRRDEEQPDAVSVISSHTASFYHDSPVLGYHL